MKVSKFEDLPEKDPYHINPKVITLANGREFVVATLPVIFGFRVVGYYKGKMTYEFNWCCGKSGLLIALTRKVLMGYIEESGTIMGIEFCSNIKPWNLDEQFIEHVNELRNYKRT